MSSYFFVQSLDPFVDRTTDTQFSLMSELAAAGNEVSLFLVQSGVASAASQAVSPEFDKLLDAGIKIYADKFSLWQREIELTQLKKHVESAELHVVIQAMVNGEKVIWN